MTLIAPTPRRKMTRPRAAKIFLREQGRCYVCSIKLRVGVDRYQIEHPDPLCLGGSDDDADLRVICNGCHKAKTKQDATDKAKRDRIVTGGWHQEPRKSQWPKRPLGTGRRQKRASSKLNKFSPIHGIYEVTENDRS